MKLASLCMLILVGSWAYAQDQRVDSLVQRLRGTKDTTEVNTLNQLAKLLRKGKPRESMAYGEKALDLAQKIHFTIGTMDALRNIGMAYGFDNNYSEARGYLVRSAEIAIENNLWGLAASDYTNIGSIYSLQGNNQKWLENYLKALSLYEQAGDKKGTAQVLYGIGNSLASEKKYDQALESYFKSIHYFEELQEWSEIPKVYINMGKMYEEQQDFTNALAYYEKAITGFSDFNNERGLATALQYRAETYLLQQQYDLALTDLDRSIGISKKSNYQFSILECLILQGKVFLGTRKYNLAIDKLHEATAIASQLKSRPNLSKSYQLLAELYYLKGDFQHAYDDLSLHMSYKDSLFNAEKSKQIEEMQFRFDSENKEKEIEILRRDQYLNHIYVGVAIFGVLSALFIGFLIINRQRLKIKTERELAQKENQLLEERKTLMETELLNQRLIEEQLHKELEFKNKETTTYALNLIQKNELLDNIKEGIEEIRSAEEGQIKAKLQTLLNTVNYSFHLDKDWENFKKHFEQVHSTFYDKLYELNPELSPNDIKLCALIRLNLDTKQMAAVLDISPESAKVARHRLRKKLNLSSDQNLATFLSTL